MSQTNTARKKTGTNWFNVWIITLSFLTAAGCVNMLGGYIYVLSNRADPLPEIRLPKVHHDGIYPTATQELTQPIRVSVAPRHQETFRNAVVADVEQSGGRVTEYNYNTVKALAPASYVENIQKIRDLPDGPEHRNGRYVAWTREIASQKTGDNSQRAQGEWTAFKVKIDPAYAPDRGSSLVMTGATVIAAIAALSIILSYAARADLQR